MAGWESPDMVVQITANDLYELMSSVKEDVSIVKGDVASIRQKMENTEASVSDHEQRLRVMEKTIWRAMGGAALLGTGGGAAVTYLLNVVPT